MKKRTSLFFIMICMVVISCRHHGRNTSIEYSNTRHYFSMKARFNYDRTRDVEYYMDKVLGDQSKMSFINSRIDGEISFDDHTIFYIKKYPGYLQIKLDKEQNSEESIAKVQDMCQGIKELIARQ